MADTARHWGTNATERALDWPCDRHLTRPYDELYRGVTVDARPEVVFRWVCQLRAAPYSYDLLDNFGRRSPRELTPGLERLALGQRFMTIFDLVEFEQDRHVTLLVCHFKRIFGSGSVTYMTLPIDGGERTRLVMKVVMPPRRVGGSLWPWFELFMSRKQLLTLKKLAERG